MVQEQQNFYSYIAVFKKRKMQFLIPFVIVLVITSAITVLLPSIYESSSTILIEEQQIPHDFVRSTVTGFAEARIMSLTQMILSRSRLWEIIQKFNLYPKMKEKTTREEVIEKMRGDIALETIGAEVTTDPSQKKKTAATPRPPKPGEPSMTIAFKVAYQGRDPDKVMKVAGTLASLYLEQNLKTREAQAKSTTQFLQAELKALEERIQTLGNKISRFKEAHEGILPELAQFNLGQAEKMESEIKQLEASIRSAEDRKVYLIGQMETVKPDSPIIGETGQRVMSSGDRLKFLEVELTGLRSKYNDDHPDILKVRREIAELKKITGTKVGSSSIRRQRLSELKAELAQKQGKYSADHPETKKLKNEIDRLEQMSDKGSPSQTVSGADNPSYVALQTQIKSADQDIISLKKQQANLRERLQVYQKRLEETPRVEQEYLALQRDYQNAHTKHQEVMNKILEATISEGMEEHQKAEKFTLVDPAAYPEIPVKPPRLLIFIAGVVLSLFAGFGTVALAENMDHTVKAAEITPLTGVPVLGTIGAIVTPNELAALKQKRHLIWAGIGLFMAAGLMLFHLFYMDLWVLTALLKRFIIKTT